MTEGGGDNELVSLIDSVSPSSRGVGGGIDDPHEDRGLLVSMS